MKKYTFLVYHKQYLEFLEKIKDIGVLHVIEKPEGIAENDELRDKMQVASRIKSALRQLKNNLPKDAEQTSADESKDGMAVLNEVENAFNKKEALLNRIISTDKERDRMEVWGQFDVKRIKQLEKEGYVLNFFTTTTKKFDQEWEVLYNAFEIDTKGSTIYFMTVTKPGESIDIDADRVFLSSKTADELAHDIKVMRDELDEVNESISRLSVEDYNTLKLLETEVMTDIAFDKVVLNTQHEAESKVMLLEGWCPEESEAALVQYLDDTDIYYQTSEPELDEKVPIKLKNNRFARMFEFIGELYDLPNYHELDLTPYFAPFYMLFFGLCLGDAGYGLLLLVAGLFARTKMTNPVYKSVMSLVACLGGATIIMGTISGTFFGYSLLDSPIPWLQPLKRIMFDSNMLFYNALILGIIQILFGMIIKFIEQIRRFGFLSSLPTLGWLCLLLGCGGTYALSAFAGLQPETAKWMYIIFGSVGVICIFILNSLKRNPFINVGVGLWDTYNMVTGILGDVLSYIRLFALGLSGGVMGLVFNDLAINMSGSIPVLSQIIMVLIMLFGHSINIFINGLGAFVHPMRLTFVEFYKNAGFEGGGKKYRPFARYQEETKVL